MNLHEIENMTAADLKAQRAELAESLKAEPPDDLADRYLQARHDAKQRDEKLAEQGRTITALQTGLAAADKAGREVAQRFTEAKETIAVVQDAARETTQADKATIAALTESLKAQTERADRLKVVATRNHAAASASAKLLNDALAAEAVDAADAGE